MSTWLCMSAKQHRFTSRLQIVLAATLLLCGTLAWGQGVGSTSTGTVNGVVTDPSGAVVPGATITLTDRSTNQSLTTTSNNAGRYVFIGVPAGQYDLSATKEGFAKTQTSNQTVRLGTTSTINLQLTVGTAAQTVTVEATAAIELQTMNSTVGTTITGAEMTKLASSTDTSTLAVLVPGSNVTGSTAGAIQDQNTFQLDGGNITDDMSGDLNTYVPSFATDLAGGTATYHSPGNSAAPSGVIPTPSEMIEEVKIATANQTADYNQGAGMQVQAATKRGGNSWHGAAYEYYSSTTFGGANSWSNNLTQTPIPSNHYSRFGFTGGGPILPNMLGGKTYFFAGYEGYRNNNSQTFERNYPLASLRLGIIKPSKTASSWINVNPTAVTDPATGTVVPSCNCDPRNLGMNKVVQTLWNTYLPLPNDLTSGDGLNYAGYKGTLSIPSSSNFGVTRVDHDFGQKFHFNATYHYYHLKRLTNNMVDVGGFFPGDTKGQYKSLSSRPQVPWMATMGLTTNLSSAVTNDFHFSFTRNFWSYNTPGSVPNVAGFPAVLEPNGDATSAFIPYNVNNQSARWRYWLGKDNMIRDDITWLKGNHLIQVGGSWQRNWNQHERIDNGGAVNIYEAYRIGEGNGGGLGGISGFTASNSKKIANLYAQTLGIVTSSQNLFVRNVQDGALPLRPRVSCAVAGVAATAGCLRSPAAISSVVIPFYNLYFSDSWHMRPTLTLTYGTGYTIEMPPYEPQHQQDVAVDASGHLLDDDAYLAARQSAALNGQAYNPLIGYATINNVAGKPKYPFDPYYGGLSPRVALAWNPRSDLVIRGGYARIFGRLNGVGDVLVPMLAPGFMQTAQCFGPNRTTGGCGASTATAFRVGTDGVNAPLVAPVANLPMPWYPGVNQVATGSSEFLSKHFRPNDSHEFNLSIQKSVGNHMMAEVGYIGRIIHHEYLPLSMVAIPYMITSGGQTFANAWANVMLATNYGANAGSVALSSIPTQKFFETALDPKFCTGYANCTQAFVDQMSDFMNISDPYDPFTSISNAGQWKFGSIMPSDPRSGIIYNGKNVGDNGQVSGVITTNTSRGFANYNGGYVQFRWNDWHGITGTTNLTWSKTLGTGGVGQANSSYTPADIWNLHNDYGPQGSFGQWLDERLAYNLFFSYTPPFYKNQQGVMGRILGGWSFSPVFTAGSGFPNPAVSVNGSCQSFGEVDSNCESVGNDFQIPVGKIPTQKLHYKVPGTNGVGTSGNGLNGYADPEQVASAFRNPVLGFDKNISNTGIYGLPFWNMNLSVTKNLKWTERFNTNFYVGVNNVFNHFQPGEPCMDFTDTSTFGTVSSSCNGVSAGAQRSMYFGVRIGW